MAIGWGLVLLWTIAVILLVINPKNAANRWISSLAFFAGCGVVGILLEYHVSPYVRVNFANGQQIGDFCVTLANYFDTFPFFWCPYSFLMFCITYSGIGDSLGKLYRNWAAYILLIPVVSMYLFAPLQILLQPHARLHFLILVIWSGAYFLIGDLLLVFSCIRVKNPKIRQERLLVSSLLIPGSLSAIIINYVLEYLGYRFAWRFHALSIGLFLFYFRSVA